MTCYDDHVHKPFQHERNEASLRLEILQQVDSIRTKEACCCSSLVSYAGFAACLARLQGFASSSSLNLTSCVSLPLRCFKKQTPDSFKLEVFGNLQLFFPRLA